MLPGIGGIGALLSLSCSYIVLPYCIIPLVSSSTDVRNANTNKNKLVYVIIVTIAVYKPMDLSLQPFCDDNGLCSASIFSYTLAHS